MTPFYGAFGGAFRSAFGTAFDRATDGGLIASWDFAEASGPYVDSVNGLSLANGAAFPNTVTDGFGDYNSIFFDGAAASTEYLIIDNADLGPLDIGGLGRDTVTITAWIKRAGNFSGSAIAGVWNENSQRSYAMFINLALYGGDNRICGHISENGQATPGYSFSRDYSWNPRKIESTDTDWYFAAITYDGAAIRSYLDGTFEPFADYDDGTNVKDANPYLFADGLNDSTTSEFTVGAVRVGASYQNDFGGEIARLKVYNRALSPAEIRAQYLTEKPENKPLHLDRFFCEDKDAPAELGWRSFDTSSATDVSYDATTTTYRLAPAKVGGNEYLARSARVGIPGLAYYTGFEETPLPFDTTGDISFELNNQAVADDVHLAIRVNGTWYASSATYSVTSGNTSGSNWSNSETQTYRLARTAADWRTLNFTPGSTLSLGSVISSDIGGNDLEAVGFFLETNNNNVRIDDLQIKEKPTAPEVSGLTAWYDASDLATITESSGSVSQWSDKSGNGNHLTQPIGANQPSTGTRTVNGLNVIDHNSTLHVLEKGDFTATPSGTWFVTAVVDNVTAGLEGLFSCVSSEGSEDWQAQAGSATEFRYRINTASDGFTNYSGANQETLNNIYMFMYDADAGELKLRVNGGAAITDSYTVPFDELMRLRIPGSRAGTGIDGATFEVMYYNRVLTDAETNEIGAYLADRWGMTWTDVS